MKTIKYLLDNNKDILNDAYQNTLSSIVPLFLFSRTLKEKSPNKFLSITESNEKLLLDTYGISLDTVFADNILENLETHDLLKVMLPNNYVETFPENVSLITKYYFPGTKLRINDNFLILKLSSNQCKKFFTMIDFLESGESWRKFLRLNHNFYYTTYMQAKSFISLLESRTTISDSRIISSETDLSLAKRNNETFVLSIPTFNSDEELTLSQKINLINDLNKMIISLVEFSFYISFIAGFYDKISDFVMDEYNNIYEIQNKEKDSAIPAMKEFLKSRIVSKSILKDRKKITKLLQNAFKDVDEVFIPLTNELPFTNSYEELKLKVSIYLKDNKEMFHLNQDYKILPPVDLNQEIPGYLSTGIYDLTGFDNKNNQEESDYAPHVMMEDYFVSLDELLFVDTILNAEEYSDLHQVVLDTMKGIEAASINYLKDKNKDFDLNNEDCKEDIKKTMVDMIIYLNSYLDSTEYPNNQQKTKSVFESLEDYRRNISKSLNYLEPLKKEVEEVLESKPGLPEDLDESLVFDYENINQFIANQVEEKPLIFNNNQYSYLNNESEKQDAEKIYMPPIFEFYNYSDIEVTLVLDKVSNKYFFVTDSETIPEKVIRNNYLNIPNKRFVEYVFIKNELVATNTRKI